MVFSLVKEGGIKMMEYIEYEETHQEELMDAFIEANKELWQDHSQGKERCEELEDSFKEKHVELYNDFFFDYTADLGLYD